MMRWFLIIGLLIAVSSCYGQSLRNGSNMLVGKIDTNGVIRNASSTMIGKFESNGDIRDFDRNDMLNIIEELFG